MKTKKYHILAAEDRVSLAGEVQRYLEIGWKLKGSHKVVLTSPSRGILEYSQTLVLRSSTNGKSQ